MKSEISLVRTSDRRAGIREAVSLLKVNPVRGKDVLIKPNFNSADPFPASTHNDTLEALVCCLQEMGAKSLALGERSGPVKTSRVMKQKGVPELCERLGVRLIDFELLPPEAWVRIRPPGSFWRDGFDIAQPVLDAGAVVSTCCLKTHGYGGVFTMSLKLAVGMVGRGDMLELHTSPEEIRKMIADINLAYSPALILLDGIEAFVDGGPMEGLKKRADVILAGTDRVAIDAVGLAILKDLGSNRAVMDQKIFGQEQIARAVELGIGIAGPEEIEIVSADGESREYAAKLVRILAGG